MALEQRSLSQLRESVDGQLDITRLDYQQLLANTIEGNLKMVQVARDQADVTRARLAEHIDPLKVILGKVPTRADLAIRYLVVDTKQILDVAAIEEYEKGELERFAAIFDNSVGLSEVAQAPLVARAFTKGTYQLDLAQDPDYTQDQKAQILDEASEYSRLFKRDHTGLAAMKAARDNLTRDLRANPDSLYLKDFVIAGSGLAIAMHEAVYPLTRNLVTHPQQKVGL